MVAGMSKNLRTSFWQPHKFVPLSGACQIDCNGHDIDYIHNYTV